MVRQARFDRLAESEAALASRPGLGVLFDLGVSSAQLDRPERGFSYRARRTPRHADGPGRRSDAAEDVATPGWSSGAGRLFAANGEARFASRIARAVVRPRGRCRATGHARRHRALGAIPAAVRRHGGHPARRVFQALRSP